MINMQAAVKSMKQRKDNAWKEEFSQQVDAAMDKLTTEETNVFVHAVFNAVCIDVAKGLQGAEDTVFFDAVAEIWEKVENENHKCYFNNSLYDGNETPWDPTKIPLCVLCAKKAQDMITYYGGKPGRIVAHV